jgi:membrane protease YdiL (CAAX protease family)
MELKLEKPGFWMAAVLALMVVVSQAILAIPLAILDEIFARVLQLPRPGLAQNPLMAGFINIIACGGAIAVGLWLNRLPPKKAFPLFRVRPAQLAAMAPLILGGDVLLSEADNLFRSIAPPPQFLLDAFREVFSGEGNLLSRIFLLVIVAPITEELLFRGVILRGLLGRYPRGVAVLLTALLFAAVHMNPWQFISAFFLGVAFGWFYLRTGSILLCILAHAISNGLFVLFTSLSVDIPGLTTQPVGGGVVFQPWWLDLIGVLLLMGGIFAFRAATPNKRVVDAEPPQVPPPSPAVLGTTP